MPCRLLVQVDDDEVTIAIKKNWERSSEANDDAEAICCACCMSEFDWPVKMSHKGTPSKMLACPSSRILSSRRFGLNLQFWHFSLVHLSFSYYKSWQRHRSLFSPFRQLLHEIV
jgi:hypothetical protein